MMSFYQDRLPIYTKLRFMHRLAMVSLTTVSSILAYLDAAMYVVCATAFSGAILSWIEYSEMARKIERYTRAVRALKKLQSWWEVLSDVEQAGTENISLLIQTCEDIIADERLAWQSTAHRLAAATKKGTGEGSKESTERKECA